MKLLLILTAASLVLAASARPKNLIFIMVDDAGVGDFGCYGGERIPTPNIDRMAKEGMRFTNAYSGSAVCAPTRCVLMTGKHPGHCVRRANQSNVGLLPLPDSEFTVAESLKEAGYATGGFGKWGLGNPGTTGVPEKQGFDLFYGYYDQKHAHDYYPDHLIRNSEKVPLPGNTGGKKETYTHTLIADETLKFIREHKDEPFFVYACWTPPHGKYVIPDASAFADKPWSQAVKNYAAMVALMDTDTGRVMDLLKELGIEKDTLVIFTSDNGPNAQFVKPLGSAGGLRGVKRHLHEGGVRAPFVAWWPGTVEAGSESDLLCGHVDWFATCAEIAGSKPQQGDDSISLLPVLTGKGEVKKRDAMYWEIYEGPGPFQQAVRMGKWKGYRQGTKAPLELYDLSKDAAEENDLSSEYPEVVKAIEAVMKREHEPSKYYNALEGPKKNRKNRKK